VDGAVRDLTVVYPYYMNPGMLEEHQKIWADYPPDLRARLHVIVVDDCSLKGFRINPRNGVHIAGLGSLRIYRLTKKKRWNWLACRNLGAKMAGTEWILFTDIDHALPVETLSALLTAPLDPSYVYRLLRVDAPHPWPYALADCQPYKDHPDTWLMTKALFFDDRVGGYDERLSGCYGTSGEFRDRAMRAAAYQRFPSPMIRYPREILADASTSPDVYTRKGDPANDADLTNRKAERDKIPNWKPLHGLTPYESIYPC
jgi:hypothetical protein